MVSADNAYYTSKDGVLFTKDLSTLMQYPIGNKRTSYSIPSGVVVIDDDSFHEAVNLKKLTIPEGVTTIGVYAINMCEHLTSITLPNSVTTIKECAFYCNMLKKITIGSGVKKIGFAAFGEGSNLIVNYKGTKADWKNIKISKRNLQLDYSTVKCTNGYLNINNTYISKLTSNSKGQITVKWDKMSSRDGYQIQYATNKKFTKNKKL
ncbi:MAG: leucine-rich repeat domain-containing protein [Clostridiales bacterium]|nr:leucine-rich repeat domain-containing protein [Clostridiales bacterium]